jgi:hypothetical protein
MKANVMELIIDIKINNIEGESIDKKFEVLIKDIHVDGETEKDSNSQAGEDVKCMVTVIDTDKDENEFKQGIDEMYNL